MGTPVNRTLPPTAVVLCPNGHPVSYASGPDPVAGARDEKLQAWCPRCNDSFWLSDEDVARIRSWAARHGQPLKPDRP
jgi:hypothetical protein